MSGFGEAEMLAITARLASSWHDVFTSKRNLMIWMIKRWLRFRTSSASFPLLRLAKGRLLWGKIIPWWHRKDFSLKGGGSDEHCRELHHDRWYCLCNRSEFLVYRFFWGMTISWVDSGKQKEKTYDAENNIACLLPAFVSQASAHQRRGRAGRVQKGSEQVKINYTKQISPVLRLGICYHIFPSWKMKEFPPYQLPGNHCAGSCLIRLSKFLSRKEIRRTPLEQLCLQVRKLSLARPGKIDYTLWVLWADDAPSLRQRRCRWVSTASIDSAIESNVRKRYNDTESHWSPRPGRWKPHRSLFFLKKSLEEYQKTHVSFGRPSRQASDGSKNWKGIGLCNLVRVLHTF